MNGGATGGAPADGVAAGRGSAGAPLTVTCLGPLPACPCGRAGKPGHTSGSKTGTLGLSWPFCGDGGSVAVVVCGVAGPDTGRTTFSFHGEAFVTSGVPWPPCTFIVVSVLPVAWLI